MKETRSLFRAVCRLGIAAAALKFLLFPSAYSTDLEVHRHWKALVWSKPLNEWYTDTSSVWTLDYPPLFAYWEWFLAACASAVHPELLKMSSHGYGAPTGILFMRTSVLFTDVFLVFAVYRFLLAWSAIQNGLDGAKRESRQSETEFLHASTGNFDSSSSSFSLEAYIDSAALILFNPGLFLVDSIHFQYNGLVLAAFLLSLSLFLDGQLSTGAAAFAVTVNLKHTFLPIAPVIATHLLLCVRSEAVRSGLSKSICVALAIAGSVAAVMTVAWLPLYVAGGSVALKACLSRLFPVDRGLFHAYWAPNFWALYAVVDKVAALLGCSFREVDVSPVRGHIGAFRPFSCLPNCTPAVSACLVVLGLFPAICALLRSEHTNEGNYISRAYTDELRRASILPRATALSALSAFFFGWHVHEKMILLVTVPLAGVALTDNGARNRSVLFAFCVLAVGGHVALHPLVVSPAESTFKVIHYSSYTLFLLISAWRVFCMSSDDSRENRLGSRTPVRGVHYVLFPWSGQMRTNLFVLMLAVVGALVVELYAGVGRIHYFMFGTDFLEFLPLLLTSCYGAAAVTWAFGTLLATCCGPLSQKSTAVIDRGGSVQSSAQLSGGGNGR